MIAVCQKIERSKFFHHFIIVAIIFAGILIGLQTSPDVMEAYGSIINPLDNLVIGIFAVEIVIRLLCYGKQPWRFFKDAWNVFDFIIVLVCLLPVNGQYMALLRLARVLRVLRLVSSLPKLQVLVSALFKSIPSMGYISLLLLLLFYVYAVFGTFLFRANDPVHFADLPTSMLTMFRVVTLEDWTDIMYINMQGSANYGYDGLEHLTENSKAMPMIAASFFVSFVLFGTMIVMNLFIGIIMNGMQEAHQEHEEEKNKELEKHEKHVDEEFKLLLAKMDELKSQMNSIHSKLDSK